MPHSRWGNIFRQFDLVRVSWIRIAWWFFSADEQRLGLDWVWFFGFGFSVFGFGFVGFSKDVD
jgi:hypothetical protein